jgi:iron complex outermembrane receptor protein
MRKKVIALLFAVQTITAFAQIKIQGIVEDAESGEILSGANIQLVNQFLSTTSDAEGRFSFTFLKEQIIVLNISYIGYEPYTDTIRPPYRHEYVCYLKRKIFSVNEIEIAATRANSEMPVAQTTLSEQDIRKENTGRDLPFLLQQTPSVVVNSDAGAGIGYTGIRLRGTDGTRINVTMNGIPINDAESQSVFWVNMPDLASSASSIQVQRGVGTSTNGAGSFGGSIHIQTNELQTEPFAEASASFGSFNTFKQTAEFGTGLLGKRFVFTGRLSNITSDGYIDRGWSDLKSIHLSAGYYGKTTTVRFSYLSGKEKTYQAWNGLPEYLLDTDRTFNSAGTDKQPDPYKNETDNYQQDHYQLFINQQAGKYTQLNLALYYTRGLGYYENYRAGQTLADYGIADVTTPNDTITESDLVRQLWLDNHLVGANLSTKFSRKKWDVTGGASFNTYFGEHYGKVVWASYASTHDPEKKYYNHSARKMDGNIFGKATYEIISGLNVFADLQYRFVDYRTDGFRNNPTISVNRQFHFFNPKVGMSYQINAHHIIQGFFGIANKEPNRDDFEAGTTQQPEHETLRDLEISYTQKGRIYEWSVNGFWMDYTNQLVLNGKINDVGAYTRINIPQSYRLGVEISGQIRPHRTFLLQANATFSTNRIKSFTEYIDNYDTGIQETIEHGETPIAFSPDFMASFIATYTPVKRFDIEITGKYVGAQFMDNTGNTSRQLDAFFTNDLRLRYELIIKKSYHIHFNFMLNNFTHRMYAPNGYTFSYIYGGGMTTENFYYPQAGINVLGGITFRWSK